jgi:hypothetical protein
VNISSFEPLHTQSQERLIIVLFTPEDQGASRHRTQIQPSPIRFRSRVCIKWSWYMKNAVFWDVAPCGSCENRCFGGMYFLHLQGRKIRERGKTLNPNLEGQVPVFISPWNRVAQLYPRHCLCRINLHVITWYIYIYIYIYISVCTIHILSLFSPGSVQQIMSYQE